MTVRIDIAALTPTELAGLREQLRCRPGERRPETKLAIGQRDRLIVEFADQFHGSESRHRQAQAVCDELRRYETTVWLRTRADAECRHRDARSQLAWRILKSYPLVPGVRRIDEILKLARRT